MEKLKYYRANFDFELTLEDKFNHYINDSLEFLFFWISNPGDILITKNHYSAEYLQYIENKIKIKPRIELTGPDDVVINNWWGETKDETRAKLLNSNWEFHQWLAQNDYHHENIKFLKTFNESLDPEYYYKKEFGFSGKSFVKNEQENLRKIVKMPKLSRVKDYSVIYTEQDEYFFLEHAINKDLSWSGVTKTDEVFPKMLELFKKWQQDHDAFGQSSMDFFTYEKSDQIRVFPSEINYRKTMGYVFVKLAKRLPGFNKLSMNSKLIQKNKNQILLSPLKSDLKKYFYLS